MNTAKSYLLVLAACALPGLSAAQEEAEAADATVGWKQFTGQAAPAIEAKAWLNVGDQVPANEALQGKVWLLEFFATW